MTDPEPSFRVIMVVMRALLVVIVMTGSFPVHADDVAQRDLLVEYTRIARGSAIGGNCDIVRELGERVRALDPAYYAASYATDEAIATCLPQAAPAVVAPPPPTHAPPTMTPMPPPMMPMPARELVPPLSGGRLIGEALLGGASGVLGGLVGAYLGLAAACDSNGSESECLGSIVIGGIAGGLVGVSLGVYVVGNAGDQTGSLGATVLGAVLGGLGAIGFVARFENRATDEMLVIGAVGLPVAGAMIGFNLSRSWRSSEPVRRSTGSWGSLFQFDRGRASVGVPMVVHGNVRGTPTTSFSLLGGSF